jgi:hypothetical protein
MDVSQARCCGCDRSMVITRLYCPSCEVSLDGEFELSALARLSLEDQTFVAAFLRHHGNIRKMEQLFGVSYPTVKNRLNAVVKQIDHSFDAPSPNTRVLEQLSRGEISVDEAIGRLG